MKYPKITVTVELLPIFPANLLEEDRTEERYLEIMEMRCKDIPQLMVNQVMWETTMKAEFPNGWDHNQQKQCE